MSETFKCLEKLLFSFIHFVAINTLAANHCRYSRMNWKRYRECQGRQRLPRIAMVIWLDHLPRAHEQLLSDVHLNLSNNFTED